MSLTKSQQQTIKRFVELALKGKLEYSDNGDKEEFHSKGMAVARLIAQALGLESSQRQIRSNMGGIAVSGEVTLHADNVYVQFSRSAIANSHGFMYRNCKGQKDYSGGRNRWMPYHLLVMDWDLVIKLINEAQFETR
jgi:hypothetical protein